MWLVPCASGAQQAIRFALWKVLGPKMMYPAKLHIPIMANSGKDPAPLTRSHRSFDPPLRAGPYGYCSHPLSHVLSEAPLDSIHPPSPCNFLRLITPHKTFGAKAHSVCQLRCRSRLGRLSERSRYSVSAVKTKKEASSSSKPRASRSLV